MRWQACNGYHIQNRCGPRLLRWLVLISAVFVNSGCVLTDPLLYVQNHFKVGPNYEVPPAPVAPEWIEASNPKVENRHLQEWWQVFQDPILNSLIDTAFEQNLTLRAAGARILEARAQQAITVGNIFPQTQQMTAQYSRTNLSQNLANNPTALNPLLSKILPPGSAFPFTNYYSTWSLGFNLNWELDFWGRFRRSIESADASLDVAVANFDDALVTLLADVATNYVQYRVAQQRLKIAADNVKIQEGVLALVELQFKGGLGKTTQLDVEQAKTVLEQTRSSIPVLKIALGQANDTLCILLGMPPNDLEARLGPGPKTGADPAVNSPTWVAACIPASLLRQRPDVRSAERQVAVQSALIGVAEADLYPTLAINGNLGWGAQDLSKLFESQSFFGTITPNLKWNILNYGRITNNVRLQKFKTEELIAMYQNKVLMAAREVQTSLRGFLRSQEQTADLSRSVKAAEAASEFGMVQYRSGFIPFNTIFGLQSTQVGQQDQLAVAQGNVALNLINVYRALGGGWELRSEKEASAAALPEEILEMSQVEPAPKEVGAAAPPQ